MRPTTDRSSVSLFLMSHRKNFNLTSSLTRSGSNKKFAFLAMKTLGFLALGLVVFLAGCSYGPTGIFAGVELERRTASFSVGLPVVNVQRIAVSANGERAAVSGGQIYVREEGNNTVNAKWTNIQLPLGFTNSLDVGINDAGVIFAVMIGDSGTGAFSGTATALTAVTALNGQNVQGVLQAGDTFYFVVRNDNGTYEIRNSVGAVLTPGIDNLSTYPSMAVFAGTAHVLTSNGVYRVSDGNNAASAITGQTLTGMTALSGGEIAISTAQGNIYLSNTSQEFSNTPINSSPIQVGNTTVKFTDLIYIGNDTLLAGSQGFGYFAINTTNGNATRAINRSLSNLLDTPLYNKTISTFAYVGNDVSGNLYLGAPGEGVFFGTRSGDFIQWNPLQE